MLKAPEAAFAPATGGVCRKGRVEAVDAKAGTLTMIADAEAREAATPTELKAVKVTVEISVEGANATQIFPMGDANWKMPLDGLAAGDAVAVVGQSGEGTAMKALR